jgi:AraC family transcriptional regulator, transcriptional activator of pobA
MINMTSIHSIPFYEDINAFLRAGTSNVIAKNPNLFCLELVANVQTITKYRPPFRKGFYFIGLVTNAGKTKITYDTTDVMNLNSFLVLQSPNLLYSFSRDSSAKGYLIYFKPECFPFFNSDFEKEFPFFDLLQTNFFTFNQSIFEKFALDFKGVIQSYEEAYDNKTMVASAKLFALLYQIKEFVEKMNLLEQNTKTPNQSLFQKYIQLVNNFYIEKRTVEEYAALLFVTPNHLSQAVKATTQKNASSFINERLVREAKLLVKHTDFSIAEIAYQLNFSDPANFGKFFKKHTDFTPIEFRKTV